MTSKNEPAYRLALALAALCVPAAILAYLGGNYGLLGTFVIGFFLLLSLGVRIVPAMRAFSYTVVIFAAVSVAMFFPQMVRDINGYDTQGLIVPLLQIIMFGMGTSLSVGDFTRVLRMPKTVVAGITLQFTLMPVIGALIATAFGFEPEIAAGIVLIGSVPGGLASNVMAFLAKGNVALSVTLTAVGTVAAPIMTPFLMRVFAGQFIAVDFVAMMVSIFQMVILPIILGLIVNRLARGRAEWLHSVMPLLSMAGIAVIIVVITAAGRDNLLNIGLLLILAAMLHNAAGHLLGYWFCRFLGFDETVCRTVSFEVGMQNGGLASGIAAELGRAATLGLAPAVFGPWMNISGSVLANWWRGRPVEPSDTTPSGAGVDRASAAI